jgi:hypothetical protein
MTVTTVDSVNTVAVLFDGDAFLFLVAVTAHIDGDAQDENGE